MICHEMLHRLLADLTVVGGSIAELAVSAEMLCPGPKLSMTKTKFIYFNAKTNSKLSSVIGKEKS